MVLHEEVGKEVGKEVDQEVDEEVGKEVDQEVGERRVAEPALLRYELEKGLRAIYRRGANAQVRR